jgi:hypothetical protein
VALEGVSRLMMTLDWDRMLWTVSGGVPYSLGIMDEVAVAEVNGLSFPQIGSSHIGSHLPTNSKALGTLGQRDRQGQRAAEKPICMIHTDDISKALPWSRLNAS